MNFETMNGTNRAMSAAKMQGRSFATLACAACISVLALTSAAHAQTYVGDAYGANVSINATVVGANATVADTGNLPASGSATPLTNQVLNANVQAQTGNILSPTFTVLNGATISTSTVGTGGVATSASQIQGLTLDPNLGINLAGLGGLNLTSLVSADVISSTTTANAMGATGETKITNLNIGGNSLGNIDLLGAASSNYFLDLTGHVSATASGSLLDPDIAQIIINDQIFSNGGSTLTTDALVVKVLQGNPLANGTVTIASSTAGFKGQTTSIPEAGTLPLAGLGALALLVTVGQIAKRRRYSAVSA